MKTPRIHDFDPEAVERRLGTPLDGMPTIQKPRVVTDVPASQPPAEADNRPARINPPEHLETKPAAIPTALKKTQEFQKYSTFIRSAHKRKLKILALERDCHDYDVLDEALTSYFDSHKE